MELNEITAAIIDSAMKVHSALGPGLLEHPYQACLKQELLQRGLSAYSGVVLPVEYDGIRIDLGYRLDLLVENQVIVELKSISQIAPIHRAQLLSYLKLSGNKVGLLLNFNVVHLKDGIIRLAN